MSRKTEMWVEYARSDLRTYRQKIADNKRNAQKSEFQSDEKKDEAHSAMMAVDRAITELNEWLSSKEDNTDADV